MNLVGSTSDCVPGCTTLLAFWKPWWASKSAKPVALLETTEDYFSVVNAKTRNMVRKACRLYQYREFSYNDWLDDMYLINTSRPERCGRPMSESYTTYPSRVEEPSYCHLHRVAWIGGFSGDSLVAYCQLVVLNELGIINRILSHGDASAAMNGLIAYMAEEIPVRWIHYLTLRNSARGLRLFKEHAGFQEVIV